MFAQHTSMNANMTMDDDLTVLRQHLRTQYAGIFNDAEIEPFIRDYIGTENSVALAANLIAAGAGGKRMLDIGSGYGSNVLAARNAGIDAIGVDIEPFEIGFARNRLKRDRPQDNAEQVYVLGSGLKLPFEDRSFDIVTIMNVLEHVPDYRQLLREAVRVLRPGGVLQAVCPNYAAFRKEAHYHVPWLPFFPKGLASLYLRLLGRNPEFLRSCIHYCSNWGILRFLTTLPVAIENPDVARIRQLNTIRSGKLRQLLLAVKRMRLLWLLESLMFVSFFNPLKHSVNVRAVKRAD